MQQHWLAALRWTVREIAERGKDATCDICHTVEATHVYCANCGLSFCRKCLVVDDAALWDMMSFECAGCIIESVCHLDGGRNRNEKKLIEMGSELIKTMAHVLRQSTWKLYKHCMRYVIDFQRRWKLVCFPVQDRSQARALCLFFQELKMEGVSWAKMAHFRCALTACSRAGDFPNPWKTWPMLEDLSTGLSKELRAPVRCKEGVTLTMVLRVLDYLFDQYLHYNCTSQQKLSDAALCDWVAIVFSWWGIRCASEMWLNKAWSLGLRIMHVTITQGQCITLHLQAMKNDATGRGTEVVIAWVTCSGVQIGYVLCLLLWRLHSCCIPDWGPLFCATDNHKCGGFILPPPGSESRFSDHLKVHLQAVYEDFDEAGMQQRFSWHSLRRGGATHASRMGVPQKLVMGHGAWRSEAGIAPYVSADLMGKLSVTLAM